MGKEPLFVSPARRALRTAYLGGHENFAGSPATYVGAEEHLGRRKNNVPPGVLQLHVSARCLAACSYCVGGLGQGGEADTRVALSAEIIGNVIGEMVKWWEGEPAGKGGPSLRREIKLSASRGDPLEKSALELSRAAIVAANEASEKNIRIGVFSSLFSFGQEVPSDTWDFLFGASYLFLSADGAVNSQTAERRGLAGERGGRARESLKAFFARKPAALKAWMGFVLSEENPGEARQAMHDAKELGFDGIRFKFDLTRPSLPAKYLAQAGRIRKKIIAAAQSEFGAFSILPPVLSPRYSPCPANPSRKFFDHCAAHDGVIVVHTNGKIFGCFHLPTIAPALNFGDATNSSLQEIWRGSRRQDVAKQLPLVDCVCPTSSFLENLQMQVQGKGAVR